MKSVQKKNTRAKYVKTLSLLGAAVSSAITSSMVKADTTFDWAQGDGIWDTTTANWASSATFGTAPTIAYASSGTQFDATFGADTTRGVVTIGSGGVTTSSILDSATNTTVNYLPFILTGSNTITLVDTSASAAPAISVGTGNLLIVDAPLANSGQGLVFNKQGQVWLGGNNTSLSGGITFTSNTGSEALFVANNNALGSNNVSTASCSPTIWFTGGVNVATGNTLSDTASGYTLSVGNFSGNNTFNGVISTTGSHNVVLSMFGGQLTLTAANATGNLAANAININRNVVGQGTLELTAAQSGTGGINLGAGATLLLDNGGTVLGGTSTVVRASTLTLDNGATSLSRLATTDAVQLDYGTFNFFGSTTSTPAAQTIASIANTTSEVASANFIGLKPGSGGSTTLTVTAYSANIGQGNGDFTVNASNLGLNTGAANDTNLILKNVSGTATSAYTTGGLGTDGTQTMSTISDMIVIDPNSSMPNGSLATVDSTANVGVRALAAGEYVAKVSTAAATNNVDLAQSDMATGATKINGLVLDNGGSLNLNSQTVTIGGVTSASNAGGGTILALSGNTGISGTGSLQFGTATTGQNAGYVFTLANTTISSNIVDNTAVSSTAITSLTKAGPATLTLSGTNTYTGGTAVEDGTLDLGSNAGVLGNSGIITIGQRATLQLDTAYTTTQALEMEDTIVGSLGYNNQGAIFTPSGDNATYNGAITMTFFSDHDGAILVNVGGANGSTPAGTLTLKDFLITKSGFEKTGGGTLNITNDVNSTNASSVTLSVNQGTVDLTGAAGAFGSTSGTAASTINVNQGAALVLDNTAANLSRIATGSTVNLEGGTFEVVGTPGTATTQSAAINMLSGASTINLQHGASGGTLVVTNTSTNNNSRTVQLGSATGTSWGTLTVTGPDVGSTSGSLLLAGTLPTLVGGATTSFNAKVVPYVVYDPDGTGTSDNLMTYAGTVAAQTTGFTPLTSQDSNFATTGDNVLLTSNATLTGANTSNSLVINTTTNAAPITVSGGTSLTITSGALLTTGANNVTISSPISGPGTGTANNELIASVNGGGSLTMSNLSAFKSTILTKGGSGTMILSDANAASTSLLITNVLSGTLLANASTPGTAPSAANAPTGLQKSALYVYNGATLGGNGYISSEVSTISNANNGNTQMPLYSAGAIAPSTAATSAGTLTINNRLTLANSSNLNFYLNNPEGTGALSFTAGVQNGGNSLINVLGTSGSNGNVTVNPNLTLNINGGTSFGTGTYQLIDYTTGGLDDLSNNLTGWKVGSNTNLGAFTYMFSDSIPGQIDLIVGASGGGATTTTYTLAAGVSGGALANGRLTQGRSTTLSNTITNTGTGTADTLNFSGLGASATGGTVGTISPSSGGPLANGGGNATGTGTYTAGPIGSITLTPTAASATNATLGGAATLGTTTTASVLVDALVEHTTTFTNTGNLATDSTAAYRQNATASGNLGTVTVAKSGTGSYTPGYADNLNSGAGVSSGTLTVNVTGAGTGFSPDSSVVLLDLSGVDGAGSAPAGLTALESDLSSLGYSYVDRFGTTDASLNTANLTTFSATGNGNYDLELEFNPGPASSPSYFDFDLSNPSYSGIGNVLDIAVVPEPASLGLLGIGMLGLLARRRRDESKAK